MFSILILNKLLPNSVHFLNKFVIVYKKKVKLHKQIKCDFFFDCDISEKLKMYSIYFKLAFNWATDLANIGFYFRFLIERDRNLASFLFKKMLIELIFN